MFQNFFIEQGAGGTCITKPKSINAVYNFAVPYMHTAQVQGATSSRYSVGS